MMLGYGTDFDLSPKLIGALLSGVLLIFSMVSDILNVLWMELSVICEESQIALVPFHRWSRIEHCIRLLSITLCIRN